MDRAFWLSRWRSNRIGFHLDAVNPVLVEHVDTLSLAAVSRVFVPLCGKSLDLDWLLSRGHHVVGIDLAEAAVQAVFDRLGLRPHVIQRGALVHYHAAALDLFVGDVFALDKGTLGNVDAVYDRAALVALPAPMRARYAAHLQSLSGAAPQLLVTLDYDQDTLDGPPFAVSTNQVEVFYAARYHCHVLHTAFDPTGLKGHVAVTERVWHLVPRS
ncbi:MAG: thiopurine S-methyltransferase [Pseudomonadota bacterium]